MSTCQPLLGPQEPIMAHPSIMAFHTSPIPLLELFAGITPIQVHLNFQLKNYLVHASTVPKTHPL